MYQYNGMGRDRKMHTKFIVAIPLSYNYEEKLEKDTTIDYLHYLHKQGAAAIISTAGTSQFNLLTLNEIYIFNENLSDVNLEKIIIS